MANNRDRLVVKEESDGESEGTSSDNSQESYSEGETDEDLENQFAEEPAEQSRSDLQNGDLTEEPVDDEHDDDSPERTVDFTKETAENEKKTPIVRQSLKTEQSLSKAEKIKRANKRKDDDKLSLVKPDISTDRTMEKELIRVATRGVVQLFNAVEGRQKAKKKEVEVQWGVGLAKRRLQAERQFNSAVDAGATGRNEDGGVETKKEELNEEQIEKSTGGWTALADDFLEKQADFDEEHRVEEEIQTRKATKMTKKRKKPVDDDDYDDSE